MEITENKVTSREVKATETVDGIECAYNVPTNGDTEVARTNGIFKRDGHEIGTMSQNESEISVMKAKILKPEFVEELPQNPLEGVLYISMEHSIAVHLCPCGCGNKVFTPFSQNQWRLIFNRMVTLEPSIGNFSLPCHSHYFITNNEIRWCGDEKTKINNINSLI